MLTHHHTQSRTAYLANTAFLKEKAEGDRKKAKIYMAIKQKLFNIYNSVHLAFKRENKCVFYCTLPLSYPHKHYVHS